MSERDTATFSIATGDMHVTGLAFWRTSDDLVSEALIQRLHEAADWRGQGFVAAALLAAHDGSRVALYGQ